MPKLYLGTLAAPMAVCRQFHWKMRVQELSQIARCSESLRFVMSRLGPRTREPARTKLSGNSEVVDAGYRPANASRENMPSSAGAGWQFAIIELHCPIMTFRWLNDSRQGPEAAQKLLDSRVNSAPKAFGGTHKE